MAFGDLKLSVERGVVEEVGELAETPADVGDEAALADAGVKVGWPGGVNRRSVTELTLAFALGHLRNVWPPCA